MPDHVQHAAFGHVWIVSTHKEDMTPEEMQRRMEAWMKQQGGS